MMRGMFAAISGLKNHQVMLDATANDISNVNTIGYKSARVTFQDSLNQVQRGAAGPAGNNAGSNGAQIGLGVGLGSVDNLMSGGAVQTTGNPYDVAIQGEGFFQIGEGTPTAGALNITPTSYTRAGNFSMSSEGFLTTQGGQYVLGFALDAAGNPTGTESAIQVPAGATGFAIDQSGGVSYVDPGTLTRVTPFRLTLANFANNAGLERVGANQWMTVGQLWRQDGQHAGPGRPRQDHGGRDRDVQRGPVADVHEHDHRAARLPGQLARHLHRRRDAPGSCESEALNTSVNNPRHLSDAPRKARLPVGFSA